MATRAVRSRSRQRCSARDWTACGSSSKSSDLKTSAPPTRAAYEHEHDWSCDQVDLRDRQRQRRRRGSAGTGRPCRRRSPLLSTPGRMDEHPRRDQRSPGEGHLHGQQGDPGRALADIETLVQNDHVLALVANNGSATESAVASYLEKRTSLTSAGPTTRRCGPRIPSSSRPPPRSSGTWPAKR